MERQIGIAGLNIVLQPHTPEKYLRLIRALYSLKRAIQIRGTQCLMIGEISRVNRDDPMEGLFGRIYRFDQIDPDAPWFNIEDHAVATDDEMAQVSIPSKLKPNLVMFDFAFFPNGHKLYMESRSGQKNLSPISVKKLIDSLCKHPRIIQDFGKVEVTVLPDKEQLETIFRMYRLAKLVVDIRRPNPDDFGEDEEDVVFKRFEQLGARRLVEVVSAEPGDTIRPDDDLKMLARVASRNGKVSAIGYSAIGDRLEESTVNRPWNHSFFYDSMNQTASDALLNEALAQHQEIMRNHVEP